MMIALGAITLNSPANVVYDGHQVVTVVDDTTTVQAKSCVPDKECVPADCKSVCTDKNCCKENCKKADPKCCKSSGTKNKCCKVPKKK